MISRRFAISIIGAALSARTAGAQSTETLGSYERAVQFQVSAATNSAFVGSAEFPIHLPDDVSITPEVGMGWVPRARGDFRFSREAEVKQLERAPAGCIPWGLRYGGDTS